VEVEDMGMDHLGPFQRSRSEEYAAAFVASLEASDASARTVTNTRWALSWVVAGSPLVNLQQSHLIDWLYAMDFSPSTRQTIYERTRSWYRWMSETFPDAELPDLGPHNFGKRRRGEKRGGPR
jgi:hypothetical protein